MLLTSCAAAPALECPAFPWPSPPVLDQLEDLALRSQEVGQWLIDITKHGLKIEACHE